MATLWVTLKSPWNVKKCHYLALTQIDKNSLFQGNLIHDDSWEPLSWKLPKRKTRSLTRNREIAVTEQRHRRQEHSAIMLSKGICLLTYNSGCLWHLLFTRRIITLKSTQRCGLFLKTFFKSGYTPSFSVFAMHSPSKLSFLKHILYSRTTKFSISSMIWPNTTYQILLPRYSALSQPLLPSPPLNCPSLPFVPLKVLFHKPEYPPPTPFLMPNGFCHEFWFLLTGLGCQ